MRRSGVPQLRPGSRATSLQTASPAKSAECKFNAACAGPCTQTALPTQAPVPRDDNAGAGTDIDAAVPAQRHGPGGITGLRWLLVCLALYHSIFMYGLNTTIAADVQSAVVETFGAVGQLAWLGAGFPLGSVAVILPYGALFTSFDTKWSYIRGIVLFQAGFALCGGAPNMGALSDGRVLAGAGGTSMYLGGLTHISAMTSTDGASATWRWAFYLNLVIGAVTAPIYLLYLPSTRPAAAGSGLSVRARLAQIDYVGFILSSAAWVAFGLALVSAGTQWTWRDGRTIATLVTFRVLVVSYVLQQYFCWFTTPATRSIPAHL
ncbi:MFS drug efflux transporter [Niveomyces insectorum RCEF 264]|uniref:MFS drug efflux transporter n=1 Tax=Niveomyces insectorum RCEF 264 TaxID=1081102 RepID=A0A167Y3M5_9HYPO|nr:MFS drug efflux transporter [Niveomyces insectorum RCEF 264]